MNLEKIRRDINKGLGSDVIVTHNEGRNKIYEYEGKVVEVYNNIFIILDKKDARKKSFSYYDVLTEAVKVSFK